MLDRSRDTRSYPRFPASYPVIFAGAPFVGEGILSDLSHTGCSIHCGRTVLCGSYIKLSVILTGWEDSLLFELGRIRWVTAQVFGVEFIRLPTLRNRRLDRDDWVRLSQVLEDHQLGKRDKRQWAEGTR